MALVIATVLGLGTGALGAAHSLDKRHKGQRKELKQQQRAANKVMSQHVMSAAERGRFKHEQSSERQLLRTEQKSESHRIKQSHKSIKQSDRAA
jgi:hypothetical protein